MNNFLPINKKDIEERGWSEVDFVLVTGDAYVDHPSFGAAIISRVLESRGYKVAILSQPDWNDDSCWQEFGRPKLGFLVTGGNIDSMVNHYSVNKKRREKDQYTNDGVMGKRPDRATIVYCQCIRRNYKDAPIIIGGIEASLRKFAHYDYWDNKIRPSILYQSSADLLVYGMAERSIVAIAEGLESGLSIKDLTYVEGTVYKTKELDHLYDYITLPSFREVCENKFDYVKSTNLQYANTDSVTAKVLVEEYQDNWYIVANIPSEPLSEKEMDEVYSLDYCRNFHPTYHYIPAIEEVQFSIIANRGCFGSCAFCALTLHQGRVISSRSVDSVVSEAKKITLSPNFKGYIHDIGGPTANFLEKACTKQQHSGVCQERLCLTPKPCPNLSVSHTKLLKMLNEVKALPKVKKVFVRSGVRFDYALLDKSGEFLDQLVKDHVSGQLKVAPEHCSNNVLRYMHKPEFKVYSNFCDVYEKLNKKHNKNQFLVPYLMSSHPGCDIKDAIELAGYLKSIKHTPQQVQDFYPTPGTISTCMYYTELDPKTLKKVYVAKDYHSKIKQRALIQYSYPKNQRIIYQALKDANRLDLVGLSAKCLIRPIEFNKNKKNGNRGKRNDYSK